MHSASHLASIVQARYGWVVGADAGGVRVDEKATYAEMNHRHDGGHIERLGLHDSARNDVAKTFVAVHSAGHLANGAQARDG